MNFANFLRLVFLIPFLAACAPKVTPAPPSARDCYRLPASYLQECPSSLLAGPEFEDAIMWGRQQTDNITECNERLREAKRELNKLCGTETQADEN